MKNLYGVAARRRTLNYYGNGEFGNCQFSVGSIIQSSGSIDIDDNLTTGSKAGGPGASSYGSGNNAPPGSNVYEFTVASKNGSYDGDMFVAQFKNLVIDETIWLTVDQPCRGLFIYVDGNCTINGTLGMSCRGGFSNPSASGGSDTSEVSATGLRLPIFKAGETDTLALPDFAGCGNPIINAVANQNGISGNGKIFSISKAGAAAGGAVSGTNKDGNPGSNGSINQSGGGASGGTVEGTSGAGAAGTCFSGGTGGGACYDTATSAEAGAANGGKGGDYQATGAGGGAGNPGGTAGDGREGKNGTGGLLILIVKGNLIIGATGAILAKGTSGGAYYSCGGSSGGGNILILYAGALTDSGTKNADGGPLVGGANGDGGKGGDGVVQGPTQIDL